MIDKQQKNRTVIQQLPLTFLQNQISAVYTNTTHKNQIKYVGYKLKVSYIPKSYM